MIPLGKCKHIRFFLRFVRIYQKNPHFHLGFHLVNANEANEKCRIYRSSHQKFSIKTGVLKKFRKIHSKIPVSESLFLKTPLTEHLWTTVSRYVHIY